MNWIDALIAAPLLIGLYRGYHMGIIRQLASIFTWIFGLYGSMRFSAPISRLLDQRQLVNERYLTILSSVVAFLLIIAAVYLFRKSMEWGLRITWTYQLNRVLGALFGLLKSLLYVSVSVFLFHEINKRLGVVSPQLLTRSALFEEVTALNASLFAKVMQWLQQIRGFIPL